MTPRQSEQQRQTVNWLQLLAALLHVILKDFSYTIYFYFFSQSNKSFTGSLATEASFSLLVQLAWKIREILILDASTEWQSMIPDNSACPNCLKVLIPQRGSHQPWLSQLSQNHWDRRRQSINSAKATKDWYNRRRV